MVLGLLGPLPFVRYAVLVVMGEGGGHLQSLILGAVLMFMACVSGMLGVVADLIRTNRSLLEHSLELAKRGRFDQPSAAATARPTTEPGIEIKQAPPLLESSSF